MFGLSKKKKKEPSIVVATLNARMRPMDRGDLEDAFDAVMARHGYGIRVVGGGTQLASNGEVSECDIEIEMDELSDEAIELVRGTLTAMLAPKGSSLFIEEQSKRIEFGTQEGLALYLNGTDLPDHVYRDCDSNHVYEECGRLLEGIGSVSSHWQGPQETALYMYGTDFDAMQERLTPFLQAYPLCQRSRVAQIA